MAAGINMQLELREQLISFRSVARTMERVEKIASVHIKRAASMKILSSSICLHYF
jgi:hypothetical protein